MSECPDCHKNEKLAHRAPCGNWCIWGLAYTVGIVESDEASKACQGPYEKLHGNVCGGKRCCPAGCFDAITPKVAYKAVIDDGADQHGYVRGYYWHKNDAKMVVDSCGYNGHVEEVKVVLADDRHFIVGDFIKIYNSAEEEEREVALAKLSSRERKILGL